MYHHPVKALPTTGGDPAEQDFIGHRHWVRALVQFISDILNPQDKRENEEAKTRPDSFLILLEGSWGAGKSSILRLLVREGQEAWTLGKPIIVELNAWLHQRSGPIWWTLIQNTLTAAEKQVGGNFLLARLRKLRLKWLRWKFFGRWLTTAIIMIVLLVAIGVFFAISSLTVKGFGASLGLGDSISREIQLLDAVFGVGEAFFLLVSLLALLLTTGATYLLPRRTAVERFLKGDPDGIEKAKSYFSEKFFAVVDRPCIVIVDDLDRCDPKTVVDSLYALQTVLRSPRFIYIVAADRRWLRLCLEDHFGTIAQHLAHDGSTLGDRFLDKIFQLSIQAPRLSDDRAQHYAVQLVTGDPTAPESKRPNLSTLPVLTGKLEMDENTLYEASRLLNGNPRLINRFTNELSFQKLLNDQIRGAQEQEKGVRVPCLAYCIAWTVLRIRWPALAEFIDDHPHSLKYMPDTTDSVAFGTDFSPDTKEWFPGHLLPIFSSEDYCQFISSKLFPNDKQQLAECLYLV